MTGTIQQPVFAGIPGWLNDLAVDIFFAALIVGFFSLFAQYVGVPRLHLYGWLFALGILASTALALYRGYTFHFPLAVAGLIVLLVGLTLFSRFVRRYPATEDS
jgi:hypothetical protein